MPRTTYGIHAHYADGTIVKRVSFTESAAANKILDLLHPPFSRSRQLTRLVDLALAKSVPPDALRPHLDPKEPAPHVTRVTLYYNSFKAGDFTLTSLPNVWVKPWEKNLNNLVREACLPHKGKRHNGGGKHQIAVRKILGEFLHSSADITTLYERIAPHLK